MYKLNKDIFFVKGSKRGAIYNLNDGKVYSINEAAVREIENQIGHPSNSRFISELKKSGLYGNKAEKYIYIKRDIAKELSMAWLEITECCNLKCLHCYEGERHVDEENVLSLDAWKNIIDQMTELKIKRIVVIGGEPCVSEKIDEILSYLTKRNISTTLFTNATILKESTKNLLKKHKIDVKVSIYGSTSNIHDHVTQTHGSFNKTIANVTDLIKSGVIVSASVIAMRENENDLANIEFFVKKIGMKYSRYDVIRDVFNVTQNMHTPNSKDVIRKSLRTKPEFNITKEQFFKAFNINTCWYGRIAITSSGNVLPCVFERNIVYGNVKSETLKNIINNKLATKYWFLNFDKVKVCSQCEYRYACKDCRPLGISMNGDLYSKNPRCMYNPITGIWETDNEKN